MPKLLLPSILAASVFVYILANSIKSIYYPDSITPEEISVLADIIKVLIGGLIGYMSADK